MIHNQRVCLIKKVLTKEPNSCSDYWLGLMVRLGVVVSVNHRSGKKDDMRTTLAPTPTEHVHHQRGTERRVGLTDRHQQGPGHHIKRLCWSTKRHS